MENNKIRGLDKFVPDTNLQKESALNELENFILRPYLNNGNLLNFSKEDIEKYLRLDEYELMKEEMNEKTIRVCIVTKKFIKEHYDEILKKIKEMEELENGER